MSGVVVWWLCVCVLLGIAVVAGLHAAWAIVIMAGGFGLMAAGVSLFGAHD